jgi:hypothetical protein
MVLQGHRVAILNARENLGEFLAVLGLAELLQVFLSYQTFCCSWPGKRFEVLPLTRTIDLTVAAQCVVVWGEKLDFRTRCVLPTSL